MTSTGASCAGTPASSTTCVVGRLVTVGLFLASAATVYLLDTARDTFGMILQIGAGTGLLYLVRWFWWRVNAWCEIVAMTSSLVVSIALLVLRPQRRAAQRPRRVARDGGDHHRVLGRCGLSRPANRSRHIDQFLPQGQAIRPGMGTGPPRSGRPRSNARRGQHSARAARLGLRVRGDLVGALSDRHAALRPMVAGRSAGGRACW